MSAKQETIKWHSQPNSEGQLKNLFFEKEAAQEPKRSSEMEILKAALNEV